MAGKNTSVDELAVGIQANTDAAAASIDRLTESLSRLVAVLTPAQTQLAAVANILKASRGASASLRTVMEQSAKATGTLGANAGAAAGKLKLLASAQNQVAAAMRSTSLAAAQRASLGPSPAGQFASAPAPAIPPPVAAANVGVTAATTTAQASGFARTGRAVQKATQNVRQMTTAVNTLGSQGGKSVNTLGGSFIQLRSSIFFAYFALHGLARAFTATLGAASNATEILNLFEISFGDTAEAAAKWVDVMATTFGLDPTRVAETAATFKQMAQSMNITGDAGLRLSQNLTQLSYDFASLRDQPFAYAAKKFQSALAGQTRAIREYGLDITQASLQEEIWAEGLDYKISELNRASKAVLIHNRVLRDSAFMHGDLARTINQPANMMRVLKDQVTVAARSIGYMLLPILKAVLPWLIAFAMAINRAAVAFAGLFGINVPSWGDFTSMAAGVGGGVEDIYENMSDVGGATDKAASAMKKLRDYTLGIDELNILAPETPSSSGGGGGGAGGGGGGLAPGIEPFDLYDMIGGIDALGKIVEPVKAAFAEITKVLQPFIDAVGRAWEALKPFAQNVWKGFVSFYRDTLVPLAGWTLNTAGVFLLDRFTGALEWFNQNPRVAEAIGQVFGALLAVRGLGLLGKFIGMLGHLTSVLLEFPMLKGILGGVAKAFGALLTAVGGFSLPVVAGIAAVAGAGYLLYKNWDKLKAAAKALWDGLKPIRNMFVRTAQVIKKDMQPVFAQLKDLWKSLTAQGKGMGGILGQIFEALKPLGGWLMGNVLNNFMSFIAFINGLLRAIPPLIGMVTAFAQSLSAIGRMIVGVLTFNPDEIKAGFTELIDSAQTFDKNFFDVFKNFKEGWTSGSEAAGRATRNVRDNMSALDETSYKTVTTGGRVTTLLERIARLGGDAGRGLDMARAGTDRLRGANLTLAESDLRNRDAQKEVKRARDEHATAVKKFGENSDEAKEAALRLEIAEYRALDAVDEYKKAMDMRNALRELEKLRTMWSRVGLQAYNTAKIQKDALAIKYAGDRSRRITGPQEFARGGLPPMGSAFIAGEAGPELIGSYGGNPNTVMPLQNSGFVEAMAGAVYGAVAKAVANLDAGGGGDIYMDGQKVGAVVRASESRTGVNASLVRVT